MSTIDLKVKDVKKNTENAITIFFEKPDGFDYKSGQFLTLHVPVGGKEFQRCYSLCSAPHEDFLSVTVKRVQGGKVSNHLIDNLKPGGILKTNEVSGKFAIESGYQRHAVLIGAGSGITPLMSMLKTVLEQEAESMVSLLYSNKTEEDTIYLTELNAMQEKYGQRLRLILHNTGAWTERRGLLGRKKKVFAENNMLTPDSVASYFKGWHLDPGDPIEFYLCGPKGFMDVAEEATKSEGFASKQVMRELFVLEVSEQALSGGKVQSEVTIKIAGNEHTFEVKSKSILFTALDSGVDMPYSCQSGICTACMGKCTEGEVEMEFSDSLTEDQVNEGYVLTCIGHPKTPQVTIEVE